MRFQDGIYAAICRIKTDSSIYLEINGFDLSQQGRVGRRFCLYALGYTDYIADFFFVGTKSMCPFYPAKVKYVNEVRGFNSRLDPLQAAALRAKLNVLDKWNARRAEIAARYTDGLADTGLVLPFVPAWAEPVWHLYVIQHPQRNWLQQHLHEAGIGTLIHYPIPAHLQAAYAELGFTKGSFPIAEQIHEKILSLPMFPSMASEQVNQVIANCRDAQVMTE